METTRVVLKRTRPDIGKMMDGQNLYNYKTMPKG